MLILLTVPLPIPAMQLEPTKIEQQSIASIKEGEKIGYFMRANYLMTALANIFLITCGPFMFDSPKSIPDNSRYSHYYHGNYHYNKRNDGVVEGVLFLFLCSTILSTPLINYAMNDIDEIETDNTEKNFEEYLQKDTTKKSNATLSEKLRIFRAYSTSQKWFIFLSTTFTSIIAAVFLVKFYNRFMQHEGFNGWDLLVLPYLISTSKLISDMMKQWGRLNKFEQRIKQQASLEQKKTVPQS